VTAPPGRASNLAVARLFEEIAQSLEVAGEQGHRLRAYRRAAHGVAAESEPLEQLAADVCAVQEGLGFYAVINHGVSPAVIDDAVDQVFQLFHSPEEERQKYRGGYHLQGYWPAATTGHPDGEFAAEKEKISSLAGWTLLRERTQDDPKVKANKKHRTLNKWPDPKVVPLFRASMLRYQDAMLGLALKFLPIYAVALNLPPDYFASSFKAPEWYQRCNYYSAGRQGSGGIATVAHVDHSFLTLLPMSPVPGLEVRTHDKRWMSVSYVKDAIIVNTGEWLSQITNGRFLATPHRVVEPGHERVTLPLFLDPEDDSRNDPVPGSPPPLGKRSSWPRRTFHEHFVAYLSAHYKSDSSSGEK